ncbi:MAG: ROK family protein, partial [Anaerolineae bacterium]|nr:ROK family protein [Anaerolineae bacterium]
LPVYVENDVNTLTITEQLFGAGYNRTHFIVVTVGRGIGMGMVIKGQLYQGAFGGAGEFGHTVILSADGAANTLETLAADPAVVAAVPGASSLAEVVTQADAGSETAIRALAESGTLLGTGIANLVNIISPELVIVSGEGIAAGRYRVEPMLAADSHRTDRRPGMGAGRGQRGD